MDRIGRFALWLWRGGLNESTYFALGAVAFFGPLVCTFGQFGPAPLQWLGWVILAVLFLFGAVVLVIGSVQIVRGLYDWVRIAWHRSAP